MHPIQHFKANFARDEMADTTSDNQTGYTVGSTKLHETESHVRNLCFVWEDGRRTFFNYADLAWVDLIPTDNVNVMLLYFNGQVVTLKGYQLGLLFDLLLNHLPKIIVATNPRYHMSGQTTTAIITEMLVRNE